MSVDFQVFLPLLICSKKLLFRSLKVSLMFDDVVILAQRNFIDNVVYSSEEIFN
jgi:hypothetical protein